MFLTESVHRCTNLKVNRVRCCVCEATAQGCPRPASQPCRRSGPQVPVTQESCSDVLVYGFQPHDAEWIFRLQGEGGRQSGGIVDRQQCGKWKFQANHLEKCKCVRTPVFCFHKAHNFEKSANRSVFRHTLSKDCACIHRAPS